MREDTKNIDLHEKKNLDGAEPQKEVHFTPDQQKCIEARNCDLLVSAAAGSGKTAVLVERIIQLICDSDHPIDIDRLLIVTFTKAAAAQMKEKISKAIFKRLRENPGQEHLERQATLVHNAQITTIDSFCLFVIRNHFGDIGLDPGFRVGDEGEMRMMRGDVLKEVIEQCYDEGDEDFLYMADALADKGQVTKILEFVMSLYDTAMSNPWPEKWLQERCYDYDVNTDFETTKWYSMAVRQILSELVFCKEKLQVCKAYAEEPDGPYKYGELIDSEIEMVETAISKIQKNSEYLNVVSAVSGIQFGRLPIIKDSSVNEDKKTECQNVRKSIKESIGNITKDYLAFSKEATQRQMEICEKILDQAVKVCLRFMDAFSQEKRSKNILDFSDIEHFALQILLESADNEMGAVPTKTAMEYRNHFQYVMIDEYQDSNLVQEYLLAAVAGQKEEDYNRFMVGDVKQSIYKFRLARPEIFMEKYDAFAEEGTQMRVDLHQNFRSRAEVIDAVNFIFRRIMWKDVAGIEYDDAAALHVGASYPKADDDEMQTEVIVYTDVNGEDDFDKAGTEAYGIANRIKDLINYGHVTDEKTGILRQAQYKDIVILLRSLGSFATTLSEVLANQGIPVHISSKTGYFGAYEIRTLLQILQVINNPLQDIPFYGALHSPIGGMNDNEIALIRSMNKEKKTTLYEDCLEWKNKYQTEGDNADVIGQSAYCKITAFLELFEEFRQASAYLTVYELLQKILHRTDYCTIISAMPGGDKRLANVEMLLQKAISYESTSYYGLYDFVRYMEQLEKYEIDFGEVNTLGEQANVVRIMTIHSSKGLEFPICFVAGMNKAFNLKDTTKAMLIDTDYGVGMKCIDTARRTAVDTMRRKVLSEKMKRDSMAEEMRVLYVALTRAKEKMIITATEWSTRADSIQARMDGVSDGYTNPGVKENGHLSESEVMVIGAPLEWILGAYDADAPYTVTVIDKAELEIDEVGDILEKKSLRDIFLEDTHLMTPDELLTKQLADVKHRRYHHDNLRQLYTKTSVSELKKAAMQETDEAAHELFDHKEIVPYIPQFMQEEDSSVDGTVRGNAYHKYMELFDFKLLCEEPADAKMVKTEMDRMLKEGLLAEEYAKVLWVDKLVHFLQSDAARRMARADQNGLLYREQPFVMGVEATRLKNEFPADEMVLIQGIIDVFWEEDGKIILLDYKTDRVDAGKDLIARYKAQMDYYEEALTRMKGEVAEKIIYSFGLLEEIMVQ